MTPPVSFLAPQLSGETHRALSPSGEAGMITFIEILILFHFFHQKMQEVRSRSSVRGGSPRTFQKPFNVKCCDYFYKVPEGKESCGSGHTL